LDQGNEVLNNVNKAIYKLVVDDIIDKSRRALQEIQRLPAAKNCRNVPKNGWKVKLLAIFSPLGNLLLEIVAAAKNYRKYTSEL
jgi:hypothetical protein